LFAEEKIPLNPPLKRGKKATPCFPLPTDLRYQGDKAVFPPDKGGNSKGGLLRFSKLPRIPLIPSPAFGGIRTFQQGNNPLNPPYQRDKVVFPPDKGGNTKGGYFLTQGCELFSTISLQFRW